MKRGDTRNPLLIDMSYDDGTFPDLDAVQSARFLMRSYPNDELILDADLTEGLSFDNAAHTATFDWAEAPQAVAEVGVFRCEIETLIDDKPETFPTSGQIVITIEPDLG